jgi:hypothetical protein
MLPFGSLFSHGPIAAAAMDAIVFEAGRTVSATNIYIKAPVYVDAVLVFENTGVFSVQYSGLLVDVVPAIGTNEWLAHGVASDWEIRVTKTAGSNNTAGNALATWLGLGTTRSWTWGTTGSAGASITGTVTIDFRRVGDTDPRFTFSGVVVTADVS